MFGAIILNRNLGQVCDELAEHVSNTFPLEYPAEVVDCSTDDSLASKLATVRDRSSQSLRQGLRFGRGMNQGIQSMMRRGSLPEWILLLPVDTEIVTLDLELLRSHLGLTEKLVAVKPATDSMNPYQDLLGEKTFGIGWNFEEGPWIVRGSFVQSQVSMDRNSNFFDETNFRGYLTSIELAFRAFVNGFAVGLSKAITVSENESYLLEKSDLIKTETMSENARLMLTEGTLWLREKYRIEHPWSFELMTGFLFDRFLQENPGLVDWALRRSFSED